jgi:hypothetical protein
MNTSEKFIISMPLAQLLAIRPNFAGGIKKKNIPSQCRLRSY